MEFCTFQHSAHVMLNFILPKTNNLSIQDFMNYNFINKEQKTYNPMV